MNSSRILFRLYLPVFVFLLFISPIALSAQNFDRGLQYYQNGEYEKAVSIFNRLTTLEGYLFTGKSFYALGQYDEARTNLNNITPDAPVQIYQEALYTSALINFQQKEFGEALQKLNQVTEESASGDLRFNARDTYQQILNYLTAGQREKIIIGSSVDKIKYDLLEAAMGRIEFEKAQELYEVFTDETGGEWTDKAAKFEDDLQNASAYDIKYNTSEKSLQPPDGTIYNIGVALPKYNPEAPEFEITKALYFGALLAANQFNDNHSSTKAVIRYAETETASEGLRPMVEKFTDQFYGDIIIGPLFSKQAKPMVPLVTDMEIPTIAPLANSEISVLNSYLFQANPTFPVHGRQMAHYAIEKLGVKNIAIIADRNSNGVISAQAFREEAEKLGAEIIHYTVEDLKANEFEISRHTKRYGSEKPLDAIYAPFTGQRAPQLIDLLLRNLQSMNMTVTVLGSREWQNLDLQAGRYRNFDIYFSTGTYPSSDSRLSKFKNNYQRTFNTTGNQYSMVAYDVCRFILDTLDEVGNPALLKSAIATQLLYRGVVQDIYFNGGNVNEALKILEISSNGDFIIRR